MNPINLYSTVVFLLAGLIMVWVVVLRRRFSRGRVGGLVVLTLVIFTAWLALRPVQTPHDDAASLRAQIGAGKPVLLEFQSPY